MADAPQGGLSGAVVESLRWDLWGKSKFDGYGMALVRSDAEAILAEPKPLFGAIGHKGLELIGLEFSAALLDAVKKFVHLCPALFIEGKADELGLVPQDQA